MHVHPRFPPYRDQSSHPPIYTYTFIPDYHVISQTRCGSRSFIKSYLACEALWLPEESHGLIYAVVAREKSLVSVKLDSGSEVRWSRWKGSAPPPDPCHAWSTSG